MPEQQEYQGKYLRSRSTNTVYWKQFSLKHVFRAGAIVWYKFKGKDYYVVFKSISRPGRGVQIPGGRVEKFENVAQTIIREVHEETGLRCKIVCPLGFTFYENKNESYSNLQVFFLIKPVQDVDVDKKWKHIDKDVTKQELECWFVPVSRKEAFLLFDQGEVVRMFRKWLKEHKKPPKKTKITTDVESIFSQFSKLN